MTNGFPHEPEEKVRPSAVRTPQSGKDDKDKPKPAQDKK
jgi:hypothetical protein